jgi:hypothetical protein
MGFFIGTSAGLCSTVELTTIVRTYSTHVQPGPENDGTVRMRTLQMSTYHGVFQ